MGVFSNESKRNAKRMKLHEWVLWSMGVRVASNEAAVACAAAEQAGNDELDTAQRLLDSIWGGALQEASTFYPAQRVEVLAKNPEMAHLAVEMLKRTQIPFFKEETLRSLHRALDRVDPSLDREVLSRLADVRETPVDDWVACPICNGHLGRPAEGVRWCGDDQQAFSDPRTDLEVTDEAVVNITGVLRQPFLSPAELYLKDIPVVSILRPAGDSYAESRIPTVVRNLDLMNAVAEYVRDHG